MNESAITALRDISAVLNDIAGAATEDDVAALRMLGYRAASLVPSVAWLERSLGVDLNVEKRWDRY